VGKGSNVGAGKRERLERKGVRARAPEGAITGRATGRKKRNQTIVVPRDSLRRVCEGNQTLGSWVKRNHRILKRKSKRIIPLMRTCGTKGPLASFFLHAASFGGGRRRLKRGRKRLDSLGKRDNRSRRKGTCSRCKGGKKNCTVRTSLSMKRRKRGGGAPGGARRGKGSGAIGQTSCAEDRKTINLFPERSRLSTP